jgi:hypothetical protein
MREFFSKNETQKKESEIPVSMYSISGYDSISEKNRSRYEKGFQSFSPIIEYTKKIESADRDVANVILSGIQSSDLGIKRIAIHHLHLLDEKTRTPIITELFHSENEQIRKMSIGSIFLLPEDQRFEYISTGIKNESLGIQEECLSCVPLFENDEDRKKILEIGINSQSLLIKDLAMFETRWLPEEEQVFFQNKIKDLIDKNFDTASDEDKKIYVRMIPFLKKEDAGILINKIFSLDQLDLKKICLSFLHLVSNKDMRKISNEIYVILSKTFIDNDKTEDPRKVSEFIWYTPWFKKKRFFNLAKKQLQEDLIKPLLYNKLEISKDNLSRHSFPKTGSETILFGGKLKDKIILRKINPEAFFAWKELYDDHKIWKENGFDYVPIEPIASYNYIPKTGSVDVYTGVLDINFNQLILMGGEHTKSINTDIEKIKNVLEKKKIEHGHPHNENFCLRFFRNKDGSVDLNKKPRVYLIDFDRAFSFKENIPYQGLSSEPNNNYNN